MKRLARTLAITLLATQFSYGQQYALELAADSRVEFPHNSVMNTGTTATIEFWARATSSRPTGHLSWDRYATSAEHKQLTLGPEGEVEYVYAGSPWQNPFFGGAPIAPAGSFPLDMDWHHVAFVRRATGAWAVYVDGTSVLAMGPGTGLGSGCWLTCDVINANTITRIGSGGGWQLDSLRVSNIERYFANFDPEREFMTDGATAMLLDFDAGSGAQVLDSGVANQVGQIVGNATWVALCDDPPSCCASGPVTYCAAKVNSLGCTPTIGFSGAPSLSGPDNFYVTAANVLSEKTGMLLWSREANAVPFVGGTLCVRQPIVRTQHQFSGGGSTTSCNGTFSFHFSQAFMTQNQIGASDTLHTQYWYRDPGFPLTFNVGLTQGLKFSPCP
jgi:hypothetical protein